MDQFYQKNQEYPIIIWTDSQISNWENKLYCEKLQTDYQNAFQAFNDISEAIKILQKIGDKDVTILTSGQYAYQLVKHTKKNIIVFCGRRQNHLDLFMNNFQIQSIVSDSFQSAHENVIMSMNYSDIQNQLIKLLSPPQQQSMEYQHSKYHVSIQFLVAIEEIKEEKRPNQQDVFGEIENLLIENKQQKMSNILKDLDKQEQKKKKKRTKTQICLRNLFIFIAEMRFMKSLTNCLLSMIINQQKTLLHDNQSKEDKFQNLFRGTSFDQQGIFQQIIKDLNQSRDEGASIFWNTIASASQVRDVAKMYAKEKEYGILYEITLDKDAPHPFFQLQDYHSHYPVEKEVILFPQFEFIVQEITFTQEGSKQIYTVKIKQVKNNYAFALDPTKRKIYWDSIIEQKIKPKIDTLVNFQSKRIFELISFSNQNYNKEIQRKIFSSIETELENTFQLIHNQLQQIFFHSKYPNIVNQITSLTKTYTEIVKCRYDDQSAEIAKLHIDQVMK
ncbi:unnamed protein product [Paramecium primaurelia]|uniref:NAD(P)(+)--arginine ADP-ribosyltransferase n=1 Tax=Paramecium primaurelia TaxID=5886 RepID=A0A8S1PHR1_PARPR|nr:unnamed protein product [Paramecium primaurelia]